MTTVHGVIAERETRVELTLVLGGDPVAGSYQSALVDGVRRPDVVSDGDDAYEWTEALEPNGDISPPGTQWRYDTYLGPSRTSRRYMTVLEDPGTVEAESIVEAEGEEPEPSALATHAALQGNGTHLPSGGVTASQIADEAVTVAKLAPAVAEFVRDTVASFIVQGSNVTVTHNDGADTLTIAASGGSGALADGDYGSVTVSGSGTVITIDTGAVSAGMLATDSVTTVKIADANVTAAKLHADVAEFVRDTIATALVAGANVTITPNDGADTITIASSGGGGGGTIADGDYGDVTVSSSGTVINIDAGAVGATELASDAVTTAKILDGNVTLAKIVDASATSRVLGRITSGSGDWEELTPANLVTLINTADGSGSGLDADLVDGNQASALLARSNHTGTQTASTISDFDSAARTATVAQTISNGTTTSAPSQDAVFDALALKVGTTGDETIAGTKTFSTAPIIPTVAYDATTWNGSQTPATKDAVRDKIEDILDGVTFTGDVVVPAEAYGVGWNGSNEAPTKNDVYDQLETFVEIFAADPTELDVAADGEVTILSPIARQADVDTEVDRLDTYLPVYVEKPTSNQTISSTSAADITGMTLALTVGTWQLDGVIYYEGTAGAGSNLAITWTVPSSATGSWTGQGPAIATAASGHIAATVISRRRDFTQEEIVGATGSGQICAVHLFGKIIVPNAGDLLPRARLDSGSDNITIHAATSSGIGSWLVGHRVA